MSDVLEVSHLKKYYPLYEGVFRRVKGYVAGVDDVSFSLAQNEVLAIVGESGSGKTTLGKCLVDLLKPTSGTITSTGKRQMIFQDPGAALNPRQTVFDALIEPLLYHRVDEPYEKLREEVIQMSEQVGIEAGALSRFPHEFSLGQKQRLAIARSLLVKPQILVCDEPVSALDVSIQAQILNLFLDLKALFNMSFIFISHDLRVVRFLADRVLVMLQGKIVEEGSVKDVFENPQHNYTRKLIDTCPVIPFQIK